MKLQDYILRAAVDRGETFRDGPASVTTLVYYFRDAATYDAKFANLRGALFETWRHCGKTKTVVVTNAVGASLAAFAGKYPWVEPQVEPSLVPGNLYTMSADCDARLADRFSTPYLLIVQEDGFPLRDGLEKFLGLGYDYIGAPYVRDRFLPRLLAKSFNHWTMNGGFSLRSHRVCEWAARYWREQYHAYGDCHAVGEDAYYTETLVRQKRAYRRTMRFPENRLALSFAWDDVVPSFDVTALPFGFHRASTFERLSERFSIGS